MDVHLSDLYRHQAWADALHVQAVAAHPALRDDDAVRRRLAHILTVQRYFLWMAGDRRQSFVPPSAEAVAYQAGWKHMVRAYHDDAIAFVDAVPAPRLAEPLDNPFAPTWAGAVTLGESLLQCVMHSQYHSGQNATRLRELGVDPPMTDLIAWYWSGRELPRWD